VKKQYEKDEKTITWKKNWFNQEVAGFFPFLFVNVEIIIEPEVPDPEIFQIR